MCVEAFEKKKGVDIAKFITDVIASLGLDIRNCRGQGYDNGPNISGAYKGAQASIRQNHSEALYVPCCAHNLNLAGVHSVESAIKIKVFFGNDESLYVFFRASPARWKILTEATGISGHRFSMTRWSSRIDDIKPFAKRPREVLAALKWKTWI